MRARVVGLVLGLVAVGAFGTSQAVAGGAHQARRLPRVVIGSYSGIRPKVVAFSGDGGNIVGKLRWRWTRRSATGHGTSDIQGCVPNCATGDREARCDDREVFSAAARTLHEGR